MAILHQDVPYRPWSDPALARLPGVQSAEVWLYRDEVFAAQMALRDRLIGEKRETVLVERQGPAADEALEEVLALVAADPGYRVGETVVRPDGVEVEVDRAAPFATIARLVQEDVLLLEKSGDEHALTGGALVFPASWTLREKLGRGMASIHLPVERYDAELARRVQRLLDLMRPGQVLWRANWLTYADPELFQPRREADRRPKPAPGQGYLRTERQSLKKLPRSGAILFGIHTYVVAPGVIEVPEQPAG